jgi:hypothetical protein
MDHVEPYHSEVSYQDYPTLRPVRNSQFLSLKIDNGIPVDETSFIGCLYRHASNLGHKIIFEERKNVAQASFGPLHAVLITAC